MKFCSSAPLAVLRGVHQTLKENLYGALGYSRNLVGLMSCVSKHGNASSTEKDRQRKKQRSVFLTCTTVRVEICTIVHVPLLFDSTQLKNHR